MNKRIYALFSMFFVIALGISGFTACGVAVPKDSGSDSFVSCPEGSKLSGNCVKHSETEVRTDGQVENVGLSGSDFVYAEVSSPVHTYLNVTTLGGSILQTVGGTNQIPIILSGKGAADVEVKLTCDDPNCKVEITVNYFKQK